MPAPALPWLLAVARNTACSEFRGTARQRSIGAELRAWVTEAELSAPDVADEVAERIAVLAAQRVTVRCAVPGPPSPARREHAVGPPHRPGG